MPPHASDYRRIRLRFDLIVRANTALELSCPAGVVPCHAEILGVALVLCQSDPVLNDGQSGSDSSKSSILHGVQRRFIESLVTQHENKYDDSD